jgi:hypothetical protein
MFFHYTLSSCEAKTGGGVRRVKRPDHQSDHTPTPTSGVTNIFSFTAIAHTFKCRHKYVYSLSAGQFTSGRKVCGSVIEHWDRVVFRARHCVNTQCRCEWSRITLLHRRAR